MVLLVMEKRHQVVLLIVAALLLFGAGYKYAQVKTGNQAGEEILAMANEEVAGDIEKQSSESEGKNAVSAEIIVHVAGEVERPGVYRLAPGSRVVDAVNMAGPTENSALDYLNLAAPLQDGGQIRVLNKEEIVNMTPPAVMAGGDGGLAAQLYSGTMAGGSTGLININTAGRAELEELPGIGPSLAQRIIDHRNKNGPFLSPEDLMSVSGIGEKRFEQIKDKICVN